MACYFIENVHTSSFTPKEYQVELLDAGRERNTIVCLNPGSNRTFVALKLLQELSLPVRRPWHCGGKRSLCIGNRSSVKFYGKLVQQLTDLSVGEYLTTDQPINFEDHQVLVVSEEVCVDWVRSKKICWSRTNLVILEDCHNILRNHPSREIILSLKGSEELPRLLGLTSPLFTSSSIDPGAIEAQVNYLEKMSCCRVETASDIVSILRFNVHPKELLLECKKYSLCDLSDVILKEILDLKEFLDDHRYDPSEIYDDFFSEEINNIPDPKKDPYEILNDFLEVLNTMGPWCADKAALVLLMQIEKLKVKTPYERHFLLLCVVSSVLLKVRAICDDSFEGLSESEKIYKYSSGKILRLIEIVKQFRPIKSSESETCYSLAGTPTHSNIEDISNCLEKTALSDNIEDTDLRNSVDNESSVHCKALEIYKRSKANTPSCQIKNGTIAATTLIPCFICGNLNCSGSTEVSNNKNEITLCLKKDYCHSENSDLHYGNEIQPKYHDSNSEESVISNCSSAKSPTNVEAHQVEKQEGAENNSALAPLPSETPYKNPRRNKGRGWKTRKAHGPQGKNVRSYGDDVDNLCGIIFVEKRFTAKILFHLFHDLHKWDPHFENVNTQFTVDKVADPMTDPREAEVEHKKQEEVLKRFRMRECNLVIATSVLEEGIELPKCNLIVRFNPVSSYKSHAHSKGRAKQKISYYISLVEEEMVSAFLKTYAQYKCTEQLLLKRSTSHEFVEGEEKDADSYTHCVPPFQPLEGGPYVDLSTSIALVNRYCAKLPSDTFTRLTPIWSMNQVFYEGEDRYFCALRLPINSPVKEDILGHPMISKTLARRITALETCRILHSRGELDNNLEPIGKEAFNAGFDEEDLSPISWDPALPRPGTTKSRQYYYKKIASCLNDCRPVAGVECYLYSINMVLTCPLPEEQNTRGRKLHPPELAPQSFGILTQKKIPKICPFPIFTRSGEVQVSLMLCSSKVVLTERSVMTISAFLNFIFTSVLRLQKYLMSFDPQATENSFFIVPTRKDENGISQVDWDFLEVIYARKDENPYLIPDEERKNYVFDPEKYSDAVVMPWYRNQDQPQYFYVAEICHNLSPKSGFPGSYYKTFEDYYLKKYGIQIQNTSQPLLDVDHTSARLNFLTPRYVNRKGVALPTSSEETKRAKRENLEQKQILVGELCLVHVVPASLWRQAVCLPCILYRLNALLLADEIRTRVAAEIGLGLVNLPPDFEWAPLDFGWSLADVLKKSKKGTSKEPEPEKVTENEEEKEDGIVQEEKKEEDIVISEKEKSEQEPDSKDSDDLTDPEDLNEDDLSESDKDKDDTWMEIGTWSNDMAQLSKDMNKELPDELSMVRYGSPTSWDVGEHQPYDYFSSDCESDESDEIFLPSETSDSFESRAGKLKITFRGDFLAEAVEDESDEMESLEGKYASEGEIWAWDSDDLIPEVQEKISEEKEIFKKSVLKNVEILKTNKMLLNPEEPFVVDRDGKKGRTPSPQREMKELPFKVESYGMPQGVVDFPKRTLSSPPPQTSSLVSSQSMEEEELFSFDAQPGLDGHPGPSPSIILQALTMSNANDGINLERLETIGDSFLKYAITTYLYCSHENIHEGKLSHLRSKQVSNLKLYRLGQKKVFGESMIASKFEPHDNWLPPCYLVPRDAEQQLLDSEPTIATLPYNLVTQHSIPDKSIADCVEALIGAYLIECGPRGALIFMSWLGIKVLPKEETTFSPSDPPPQPRAVGSILLEDSTQVVFTELSSPASPLLRHVPDPEGELNSLLAGFEALEASLCYSFRDKSYLLQAMSHASYSPNRVTDCYQRLEFLGDAVLDYLITRHLFEDRRAHSPGALTDLRSALVNNTIFASLAVKHGLHKYFRHLSPGLAEVVQRFVFIQEENSHSISEEFYLVGEEAEDVEVPKALGDVFESIAGAIFLDSNMSLDTVWKVYYRMMKTEIEQFSTKVPKSPIRELLELEPETAKFSKPEKLADGRRVRVTVEVFGKGTFKGIGRNYRIAKCTAAKCALKQLKIGLLAKKLTENPSASLLKALRACQEMKKY